MGNESSCSAQGWQILKYFLLQMMNASEYKRLEGKLKETCFRMTAARMDLLRNLAKGHALR